MDIRTDWPMKHSGDYLDDKGFWRNASGEVIGIPRPMQNIKIKNCTFSNDAISGIYLNAEFAK